MKLFSPRAVLAFLFCIILMTLPWFIGGNLPGTRTALLIWIALGTVVCAFSKSMIGTPTRMGIVAQMILVASIGYSAIQLIPFNNVNPSQYLAATREQLSSLVLGCGVFLLASCIFSDRQKSYWLFGAIAFNGVALTFFGLAQVVSETDQLFWQYDLIHGGKMFGPFVNSNNAGGYLLMCFAAANFFLAIFGFRSFRQHAGDHSSEAPLSNVIFNVIGKSIARVEATQLYALAALAITAAGVFASLSRGAIVALVISLFVGWGCLFRRNIAFAALAVAVVAAGVGLLTWTQQNDAVVSSLDSITKLEKTEGRLAHWQDGLNYAVDNLPFGSGLGTYNLMYLPYQERPFVSWYKYAENQYLQTLAEVGVPGLVLLLLFIGVTIYGCSILLSQADTTSKAVGLSGIMAILSQAVAGAFDYGLYLPANMYLMAAICGAVFGQLNWCWSATYVSSKVPGSRILFTRLILFFMAGVAVWASVESSAVDARNASRRFYQRFDPSSDRTKIPLYRQLAEYAVDTRPDDAQAHYQLALTHVLEYRLAATESMVEEFKLGLVELEEQLKTEKDPQVKAEIEAFLQQPDLTFDDAWPRSTLAFLHRLSRSTSYMSAELFEELRDSDPIRKHLRPAWDHLQNAEQACDKFWNVPLALGQLTQIMSEENSSPDALDLKEQEYLEAALERSRSNSDVLFMAGMIQHHSGNTDLACRLWNQCLTQTRKHNRGIIQVCLNEVSVRDFFEKVLPKDPYFRLRIADKFLANKDELLVRRLLLDHTKSILEASEFDEAERNFLFAEIERLSENYPIAIAYFKKALEGKQQVEWRVQMAKALIEAKMYSSAVTELKVCELFPGKHHLKCQQLLNRAKRGQEKMLRNQLKKAD